MDMTLQERVFPSISFPGCESKSTNCWMEPSLPGLGFRGRSTQTAQVQRQRQMQIKTAGHRKYTFRTISGYFVFAFYKRNPQTLQMHNQLPKSPTLKQKQAQNLSTFISLFFSASLNEILSTYQRKNKKPNRLFFSPPNRLRLPFFSLSSSFRYSKKVKLKRNFREPELQSYRSNLVSAFRINVTPISIQRARTDCHESSQRQTKKEKTKCQTEQRF